MGTAGIQVGDLHGTVYHPGRRLDCLHRCILLRLLSKDIELHHVLRGSAFGNRNGRAIDQPLYGKGYL